MKKLSDETRAKISAALKGRPLSAAHRAAIAEGTRRRWEDHEARERLSEKLTGWQPTDEQRARMSASAKRRWAAARG